MTPSNYNYRNGSEQRPDMVFSFSIFGTILALLAAALLGYLVTLVSASDMELWAGLGGGLMSAVFLCVAANGGTSRSATVIKSTSWAMLVPMLLISIGLGLWCHNYHVFIVVDGLILVAYLAIVLFVAKSGQ